MVQDNRKWMRCGYCGREHLEGPCPRYGDPRIPPKGESNRSLKASLAAERSELDRLRAELEALKNDIETYVRISSEQATENESLRKENAALREDVIDPAWALAIHYPQHWDTAAYPTLKSAIHEIVHCAGCSECAA